MAENVNKSVTVVSQPFTLSWPELLVPKAFTPKGGEARGEPEFSLEGISEKSDLTAWDILNRETGEWTKKNIEVVLVALAKQMWGEDFNPSAEVTADTLTWPFKSGDKKAAASKGKSDHYKGKKSWRGHAKPEIKGRPNAPTLYESVDGGELMIISRASEEGKRRIGEIFYAGAICTAELNAVAMVAPTGKKTVTLYLNSVVFERDGPRIGGGSNIERLRGVSGGESSYDPTTKMDEDLDDEIPF